MKFVDHYRILFVYYGVDAAVNEITFATVSNLLDGPWMAF